MSSMGVTGQGADFHKEVLSYLKRVKEASKIPVMMGFGIRTAEDVKPMKDRWCDRRKPFYPSDGGK